VNSFRRLVTNRWAFQIPAGIFLFALFLRLWGIGGGLPFPANIDEVNNYVLHAAQIPTAGLAPSSMFNPVGYTYACYLLFGLLHGFGAGVTRTFASDPGALILDARLISAIAGAAVAPVVYAAARIAFDRSAAVLAGLLAACAFLPVFYSHISVNDSAAMLPAAVGLLAAIGIYKSGGRHWYLIAGASSGLAAGTKYTGGFVIASALIASLIRIREDGVRRTLVDLALLVIAALGAFLVSNPYAAIDFGRFRNDLATLDGLQSTRYAGEIERSPSAYYAWSLSWGLGWVASFSALGGAILLAVRRPRIATLLIFPPLLLLLLLVGKPLFFARYLLPAYPALCLLAAFAAAELVRLANRHYPSAAKGSAGVLAAVALCGQPLAHSLHLDIVWSQKTTAASSVDWVKANIPTGSQIVVDQYLPPWWPQQGGQPKYTVKPEPFGFLDRGLWAASAGPALIDTARAKGWCWFVVSSYQAGRVANDPTSFPNAIAYYRKLHRQATLVHRDSPLGSSAGGSNDLGGERFSYEWSYDNYPFAYKRPGPVLSIYRLRNCKPKPAANSSAKAG